MSNNFLFCKFDAEQYTQQNITLMKRLLITCLFFSVFTFAFSEIYFSQSVDIGGESAMIDADAEYVSLDRSNFTAPLTLGNTYYIRLLDSDSCVIFEDEATYTCSDNLDDMYPDDTGTLITPNSEVSIFNIAVDDPWNYDWVEDLKLREILIQFNLCLYYLFGMDGNSSITVQITD